MYELVDLLGKHSDGQFYGEEISPVIVTKYKAYAIDKILRKRVRRGSLEYLAQWKGYSSDFDPWIPASSVKNMAAVEPTHFYVTLLSNASQKLYPSNTVSSFTVHLAQPIDLGSTDRRKVEVCEVTCHPTNVGTYATVKVIRANNALIYCDLITQQFVGSQ
jgi:hypothetical protein